MLVAGDEVRYVGPMRMWQGSTGTVREMQGERRVKVKERLYRRSEEGFGVASGTRNSLWPMQDVEIVSLWPQKDPGDPVQHSDALVGPGWQTTVLKCWQRASYLNAEAHGFHRNPDGTEVDHLDPTRIASRIALVIGELTEALEECSRGRMDLWFGPDGKPEGWPAELADVFLRLADLAETTGVDLDYVVDLKHAYNLDRPLRHGGKRL